MTGDEWAFAVKTFIAQVFQSHAFTNVLLLLILAVLAVSSFLRFILLNMLDDRVRAINNSVYQMETLLTAVREYTSQTSDQLSDIRKKVAPRSYEQEQDYN